MTGGAGFIGSHLVGQLTEKGLVVTVFDNMSTGTFSNIRPHVGKKNFRLVKADVRSAQRVREETKSSDVVFHLAAVTDIQRSLRDPLFVDHVNVLGTLNLLEACRKADTDLIVYASSCAIYGNVGRMRIREDAPVSPISTYGVSKLAAESYCLSFHKCYGLRVVCLRFFNVYGPRQNPEPYASVVARFVQRLLSNKTPIIYGDGEQSRDFVNVKDTVKACLLPLERGNAVGQAINIGSGISITINELARYLMKLTDKVNLKPTHKPAREGEVRHSCANTDLAHRVLGYMPTVSLNDGLQEYIEWFKRTAR